MIAEPGHGGNRYRVKAKLQKGETYKPQRWYGHAQYRRFIFWTDISYIFGPDSMSVFKQGISIIEQHKADMAERKTKETSYL